MQQQRRGPLRALLRMPQSERESLMKTTSILWPLAVVGAFLGGVAASAQLNATKPDLDPRDAVIAAPKNHKALYEDNHIRLLEVTVQPGETEKLHTHRWPAVAVADAPQPRVSDRSETGQVFEMFDPASELSLQIAATLAKGLPSCVGLPTMAGAHQVTVNDRFPHHFYRLEFKRMEGNDIMKKTRY
jgi:hypothetical protein